MSIQQKMVGVLLCVFMLGAAGCGFNQTTKNVWKGTKSIWYDNVNVAASIDYDDTGSLNEYEEKLSLGMMGIDAQLTALEKTMSNADKPPTMQWIQTLLTRFPWLSGLSGITANATLTGQVPGPPIKALDFLPLLEPDAKQNLRALRGYVQDTAMGPEVLLASPLYEAYTFRGVLAVYFDMRALLSYSANPDELIIISPNALLWAGKYNFASTPMAGIPWDTIVLEENSGTVSNAAGTFYWSMRYLGNIPLIFAVPVEGSFGETTNPRTGPTSEGPFTTPEPLKEAAKVEQEQKGAEEKVEIILAPKEQPRRVVRKPTPMPAPFVPPSDAPAIEPVRVPSPFGKKSDTPATTEPVAPSTEGNTDGSTEQAPQEAPQQEAPAQDEADKSAEPAESAAPKRLSPFGPK